MSTIDKQLVRAINKGSCFCIVGAGPSIELGLPSWHILADKVIGILSSALSEVDIAKYENLLAKKKYLSIFSRAEKVLGKENLLYNIKQFITIKPHNGNLYKFIANWPFPCYLTTNYDDLLSYFLHKQGSSFVTRKNSRDDIALIRADVNNVIFKIHGDCDTPEDIVLTSEQYEEFRKSPKRKYWREKISSVLHMVDLVIIGYSLSDPDFIEQLERAKQVASPNHPVFMFATGFRNDEIEDYFFKYNIRIISYENRDGTHRDLYRMLLRYNPFIADRGSKYINLPEIDEAKANLASSLFIFTNIRLNDANVNYIINSYSAIILQIISKSTQGSSITINDLKEVLSKSALSVSVIDPVALDKALNSLHRIGYISISREINSVSLTPLGNEVIYRVKAERKLDKDKFNTACNIILQKNYPELSDGSLKNIINLMERGIVRAFEKRGLEIANSVFKNDVIDLSDATDILEIINQEGKMLKDLNEKKAFADLMIEVILRPNNEVRKYLASMSHGYFAYHALGLDPSCSKERHEIAKNIIWIFDSSIILPILAKESINHNYALELVKIMKDFGLQCVTTNRLFDEVQTHAYWAIRNFGGPSKNPIGLFSAAIGDHGYKQNLFLEGYINWSQKHGNPSLDSYFSDCLGREYISSLKEAMKEKIESLGIVTSDFKDFEGFDDIWWSERDAICDEITKIRYEFGTYRSEEQCLAESEVVMLAQKLNSNFLSQSSILNRISTVTRRITWTPEAMYRFLTLFSNKPIEQDLLYQCMVQDFYYSGFDIIDPQVVSNYTIPSIRQARMEIEKEKENYIKAIGENKFTELYDDFDKIPDDQKPFYSIQFAFYIARKETIKKEQAEKRAISAEKIKELSDKERKDYEKLKTKKAEKQAKAKKQKKSQKSKSGKKKGKK